MFPLQTPRTDPNEFSRCRDASQLMVEEQGDHNNAKADASLAHEIDRALWKDTVFRATDYDNIDVRVNEKTAHLYGHVSNLSNQHRAEKAIQAIPELLGINSHLISDDRLLAEVATSLGSLEHAHSCKFFTGVSHGVVFLSGKVDDAEVALLAEKCVSSNPGVRGVINSVRVSGDDSILQGEPFLQPAIGREIIFLDGISGIVGQVIIDPNNRRVTQIVIQGKFSGPKQDLMALTNNQAQVAEKTVVIPMNLVRYLTNSSGFLSIKSTEITQYKDFNPLYFTAPKMDWVPPYPYCPGDVLFNVDTEEIENQIMVDPDLADLKISAQPTSPLEAAVPVDVLSEWEDDGGMTIQTTETVT
jgi:osmotically-inducible protein OsmY/sporulation protein YlmC with PRC-barrel domain